MPKICHKNSKNQLLNFKKSRKILNQILIVKTLVNLIKKLSTAI